MAALQESASLAQQVARNSLTSPTHLRFFIPSSSSSPSSSLSTIPRSQSSSSSAQSSTSPPHTSVTAPAWLRLSTSNIANSLHAGTQPWGLRSWALLRSSTPSTALPNLLARLERAEDPEPHLFAIYLADRVLPRLVSGWSRGLAAVTTWVNKYPALVSFAAMDAGFRLLVPSANFARVAQTTALCALPTYLRTNKRRQREAQHTRTPGQQWLRTADVAFESFFLPIALARSPWRLTSLSYDLFVALPRSLALGLFRSFENFAVQVVRHQHRLDGPGRLSQVAAGIVAGLLFVAVNMVWDWARSDSGAGDGGGLGSIGSDTSSGYKSDADRQRLEDGEWDTQQACVPFSGIPDSSPDTWDHISPSASPPSTPPSVSSTSSLTVTPERAAPPGDVLGLSSTESIVSLLVNNMGSSLMDTERTPAARQHLVNVWLEHFRLPPTDRA
ncbi:hypothetical protein V8E36_001089 [Tilletia maclaganii]